MNITAPHSDDDAEGIFRSIMNSTHIWTKDEIENIVWDILAREEDEGRCPEHALTDFIMALQENHGHEWYEAYSE